ncbi:ABC transporter permease, partial [Erysipelotrichaceae bacterium OH741_COT-311]
MNYINRAISNVTRKLSKSIILMLTFFVIGNFVVIGLGVSDASAKAKILTRQKMRAVINFEVDYRKWYETVTDFENAKYPYISNELIEKIIADKRVSTLNAITADVVHAHGFESVPLNNKRENEDTNAKSCYVDENGQEICRTYEEPNITLQGNAFPQMIEFVDGIYNLKEGNSFTADDIAQGKRVALITDTLAQLNNIRIGDTISIMLASKSDINEYMGKYGITEEDVILNLEVIGIFDNTKEAGPNLPNFDWMSRYESPENIIVVPDKAINETRYNMSLKMWNWEVENEPNDYNQNPDNKPSLDNIAKKGNITVLLNDPLKVDEFVADYEELIPEEDFIKVDANNETFKKLAKPLDTLSLYASFIVWLVVVNAVIIISLVTAL